VRNLVVLDDQMENENARRNGGSSLAKFFTQGSHHRNLTVIYIVQNLFRQGGAMRTISLNSHYIVLFKNQRDRLQVETLAKQMKCSFLVDAYQDATRRPYGYLVLDFKPQTPEELQIRTNVFDWRKQVIYVARTVDEYKRPTLNAAREHSPNGAFRSAASNSGSP
jgi:hypothetical protein